MTLEASNNPVTATVAVGPLVPSLAHSPLHFPSLSSLSLRDEVDVFALSLIEWRAAQEAKMGNNGGGGMGMLGMDGGEAGWGDRRKTRGIGE